MANVNRAVKPKLRQRQTEATRSMIREAAHALFVERGYAGTTIEAVAERAGVAVSTVYAVFGSKRGILRAIRHEWHGRSRIRQVVFSKANADSPEERLEQLARATRQQWETGSEVIAIYTGAAAADPKAAAELRQALKGRQHGLETFAASLAPHLRRGMDVARAAAILQALCLPEIFAQLVTRSGWSAQAYQAWLAQALKRELLEEADQY